MASTSGSTIAERYDYLIRDEFADVPQDRRRLNVTRLSDGVVARDEQHLGDGSRLSAIRWTSRSPRYLLIHGGGLNAHSWDSVAISLDQPVIVPDLPGHGHSSWRDDADYRPPILAQALLEWMSDACPEPVHVIGHSLGGLTAIDLAALAGDRVASVTVVDITPGREPGVMATRNTREFVRASTDFESYESLVDRALQLGIGKNRATLERGLIHNSRITAEGRIMFRHHFGSMPPGDPAPYDIVPMWDTLQNLPQPVQLVRATRGIVNDAQVQEFNRRRPEAPVAVLDAGHNVQRDDPAELARVIARFTVKVTR